MLTQKFQAICTSLEHPLLLAARLGIASGSEHDERRVHRRHTLHVDTACLPGMRETEGRGVLGQQAFVRGPQACDTSPVSATVTMSPAPSCTYRMSASRTTTLNNVAA